MEVKIFFTIGLIIGFFFFRITGPMNEKLLRNFHDKHNPGLTEKVSWFFYGTRFINKLFSILCLIGIPLVWLEIITLPK